MNIFLLYEGDTKESDILYFEKKFIPKKNVCFD